MEHSVLKHIITEYVIENKQKGSQINAKQKIVSTAKRKRSHAVSRCVIFFQLILIGFQFKSSSFVVHDMVTQKIKPTNPLLKHI